MPILKKEPDIYPSDLLSRCVDLDYAEERCWHLAYTRSRREKDLMRNLVSHEIGFYGPCAPKTSRSPAGRVRTSWLPLFSNYVFLFASHDDCTLARKSNCISQIAPITEPEQLVEDLRRVATLIDAGAPVQVEQLVQAGEVIRVRSGPFTGCEGVVIKRRGKSILAVSVETLGQSVSVTLDDFSIERV